MFKFEQNFTYSETHYVQNDLYVRPNKIQTPIFQSYILNHYKFCCRLQSRTCTIPNRRSFVLFIKIPAQVRLSIKVLYEFQISLVEYSSKKFLIFNLVIRGKASELYLGVLNIILILLGQTILIWK